MNCDVLCVDKIPKEHEKLFFGDSGNLLRLDKVAYPTLNRLFKYGFSKVWSWTAIDFTNDSQGWKTIEDIGQRIFLLNNGYQTIMDSGVVNIYNYLVLISNNNELANNYQYIAQNENIHANSYSYGLLQMFKEKATEKINLMYQDKMIQKRIKTEVDHTEEFVEYVIKQGNNDDKAKELVLKVLLDVLIIENIKFPFSFFTTFSINHNYNNAIQGFSMLLKMIARDEMDYHVPVNNEVLRILRKDKEYKDIFNGMEDYILDLLKKTEEQEKEWVDYLLEEGNFLNFNKEICYYFIEYRIDNTLKKLGFKKKYNHKTTDFIQWFNDYKNIDNQNASLQEISNNNYEKGVIKQDVRENLEKLKEIFNE